MRVLIGLVCPSTGMNPVSPDRHSLTLSRFQPIPKWQATLTAPRDVNSLTAFPNEPDIRQAHYTRFAPTR